MDTETIESLMSVAVEEAKLGYSEGGVPVGAVIADESGDIIARGHNRHLQNNDPTSHGVTQCVRNAGRRRDWNKLTLVTTLAPCPMSAGTCVLLNFKRVVIGSSKHYTGRPDWLREAGIEVVDLDNITCKRLMDRMLENRADLWQENIGK